MNKQFESSDEWSNPTWRLHLILDMPLLNPQALQWAIFDEDPTDRFEADLERMKAIFQNRADQLDDEEKQEVARTTQRIVTWDLMFKTITGDKVYLLTSAPGVAHMIGSNEPEGRKWVVSKVTRVGGKNYCWSIPFEAVIGEESIINLNKENALDLFGLEN